MVESRIEHLEEGHSKQTASAFAQIIKLLRQLSLPQGSSEKPVKIVALKEVQLLVGEVGLGGVDTLTRMPSHGAGPGACLEILACPAVTPGQD